MVLSSLALWTVLAQAPTGEYNYNTVKPQIFDLERKKIPDIWVLEFKFRQPRYIMVDVPGEGRKLVWYMIYRVVNTTDKPRHFIPRFTLVTDTGKTYEDVILPTAEQAVIMREDPDHRRLPDLLNSVSITKEPIPPSKKDETPAARYGVAFWVSPDMNAKSFEVYCTGLSNGYVVAEDPKTKKEELRVKTLVLKFNKIGDTYNVSEREIKIASEPDWTYR